MLAWITLFVGLGALIWSAKTTISAAEAVAKSNGLTNYGVAATLIATMTSVPELAVSVLAAAQGNYSVVTGTVFGSVIGLLLFSMGLIGLVADVRFNEEERRTGRRAMTIVVLVAIAATVLSEIPWYVGLLLIGAYALYARDVAKKDGKAQPQHDGKAWYHIARIVVGVFILFASAEVIVRSIETISSEYGISPFVVSFILVAIGTNLPEISIELVSAIKNRAEIAVGDILGSAVADTTLVLGSSALVAGKLPVEMSAHVAAGILLGAALTTLKVETGNKITMWEAVGLLIAYFLITATELALG